MSDIAASYIYSCFAIFCRVGACIMLMPGLSSPRVLIRARLLLAVGISLALMPLLQERFSSLLGQGDLSALIPIFMCEILTGILIGLVARLFFSMLEFMLSAIAQALGLSGIAGMQMEENSSEPALVSLLIAACTLLFFLSDLHLEVLRGLFLSYDVLTPGSIFKSSLSLSELVDALSGAANLALRLAGPFLVLSVLVNFAFGLANKMTPMIQIYFAAMPVLIILGFLLLMLLARPFMQGFVQGVFDYMVRT